MNVTACRSVPVRSSASTLLDSVGSASRHTSSGSSWGEVTPSGTAGSASCQTTYPCAFRPMVSASAVVSRQ